MEILILGVSKFLLEKVKGNKKDGNLGNVIHVEPMKSKITVVSEKWFSERHLKYLTSKYLKKNNSHGWLHVAKCDKEIYKLPYFQIRWIRV
ncbi:60S ribosomal protein L22-like 1 [Lemmus lemmus]